MNCSVIFLLLCICCISSPSVAGLFVPRDQCNRISIGKVGWSDEQVVTAAAEILLKKIGYKVSETVRTQPEILKGVSNKKYDVFMASWLPSSEALVGPYLKDGSIKKLRINLTGAKYTLAVPTYAYEQGVKNMSDLIRHKEKFEGLIFGLEKGNDGNLLIQQMIEQNYAGMGDFKLMPTSERIMLAQVNKRTRNKDWIVFLAWQPHAMNVKFDFKYLNGGDDFFGPDQGASTVHTVVRDGFQEECPNAARLLGNIALSVDSMNAILLDIQDNFAEPYTATLNWIRNNPDQLKKWLNNVQAVKAGIDPDIAPYLQN